MSVTSSRFNFSLDTKQVSNIDLGYLPIWLFLVRKGSFWGLTG